MKQFEEENENLENETAASEKKVEEQKTDVKKAAVKKLVCTSVQKIAWDNEQVVLENDEAKMIVHFKNPRLHGKHVVGKSYSSVA